MDYKELIRDVADFPEPGILFRDITPLLANPAAMAKVLDRLTAWVDARRPEAIIGIESRGFIIGMPIAARLSLPFIPVRKPGKLPAQTMSVEYTLEYGAGQLDIHSDALAPNQRAVIIDDLLATGGTARAACKLVELLGAQVVGVLFLIELEALGGRAKLVGYDAHALIAYK